MTINENSSWQELVEAAKSKGYDPKLDKSVTGIRDKALSDKAKAENALNDAKIELDATKEQLAEALKTSRESQKSQKSLEEKFGDIENITKKLAQFEEEEKKRKEQLENNYNEELKFWTEKGLDSIIPDFDDLEKKYNWMTKNKNSIVGEDGKPPVFIPPANRPDGQVKYSQAIIDGAAAANVSEEIYKKMLDKQNKKD